MTSFFLSSANTNPFPHCGGCGSVSSTPILATI